MPDVIRPKTPEINRYTHDSVEPSLSQRAIYLTDYRGGSFYDADPSAKLGIFIAGFLVGHQGYKFTFNKYPYYRINFTLSGKAQLKANRKTYNLEAGAIYGFRPGEPNSLSVPTAQWHHYFIHFFGTEAEELMQASGLPSQRVITPSNPYLFQDYFEQMIREAGNPGNMTQKICCQLLHLILARLCQHNFTSNLPQSMVIYTRCRQYIHQNFEKINSLPQILEACQVGKSYLDRLFKKHDNITSLEYLYRLKMNRAADLLLKSDKPINEIAKTVGLDDPFYFSRWFKRRMGKSPQYFRNEYLERLEHKKDRDNKNQRRIRKG